MLLTAAGARGRVREEALAEVLRSGEGAPVDLLVTVLGLLGLPGRDLLVRGDVRGGERRRALGAGCRRVRPAHGRGGRAPVRDGRPAGAARPWEVARERLGGRPRLRQWQPAQCGPGPRARRRRGDADGRPGRRPRRRRPLRPRCRQLPRLHGGPRGRRRTAAHRPAGRRGAARCSGCASGCRCSSRGRRSRARPPSWASGSGRARCRGSSRPSCRTWAGRRSTRRGDSVLFDGIHEERFYFVHSYAAHGWVAGALGRALRRRASRRSRGPPTASGSSRRSRTARCRRRSSTPRSRERPGSPSSQLGRLALTDRVT